MAQAVRPAIARPKPCPNEICGPAPVIWFRRFLGSDLALKKKHDQLADRHRAHRDFENVDRAKDEIKKYSFFLFACATKIVIPIKGRTTDMLHSRQPWLLRTTTEAEPGSRTQHTGDSGALQFTTGCTWRLWPIRARDAALRRAVPGVWQLTCIDRR